VHRIEELEDLVSELKNANQVEEVYDLKAAIAQQSLEI
jgi:hypothetical protein